MQHFASDNYAGICPEAMTAFAAASAGHAPAYGEDDWTRKVSDRLRAIEAQRGEDGVDQAWRIYRPHTQGVAGFVVQAGSLQREFEVAHILC